MALCAAALMFISSLYAGATRAHADTFTVDSLSDSVAGSCFEDCSLRKAIGIANELEGDDVIQFKSGLTGIINIGSALPAITSNIAIQGPGADKLTVRRNGSGDYRILTFQSGSSSVSGLTISNGKVPGFGGGINNGSTLTVENCVLTGNQAGTTSGGGGGISTFNGDLTVTNCTFSANTAYRGGGILNDGGKLTVHSSTFTGNTATSGGGGIYATGGTSFSVVKESTFSGATGEAVTPSGGAIHVDNGFFELNRSALLGNKATTVGGGIYNGATLEIYNSLLYGNSAFEQGGAIYNDGDLTLRSSTLSKNSSTEGAGLFNNESSFTFSNNIFQHGSSGQNLATELGLITDDGYNLSSDGGGGLLTQGTDKISTDPMLGAPADNGGPTFSCMPARTSPAVNNGNSAEETDQRLVTRPRGSGDDIGSVEYDRYAESLVVSTLADENDGTSDPQTGSGTSLREALAYAEDHEGPDQITFKAGLTGTITLTLDTFADIFSPVSIVGPTNKILVINGAAAGRVFYVGDTGSLEISNLTIDGSHGEISGAAIRVRGQLKATDCTFSNNSGRTGGALSFDTASFDSNPPVASVLRNCTFNKNTVTEDGGAIANRQGLVILDSCTISGNDAGTIGDGISSDSNNVTRTELKNCIVAANGTEDLGLEDTLNSYKSNGYNLIGTGTAASVFTAGGDQVIGAASPGLKALDSNGGPTKTMALLPTSPAFDKGSSDLTTDQRNYPRPQANADDIGALEYYENEIPTMTMLVPAPLSSVSSLPTISGKASDNTAVKVLGLALKRGSDSKYWNGTAWQTGGKFFGVNSAGTKAALTWTINATLPAGADLTPGTYFVNLQAIDVFNNGIDTDVQFTVAAASTAPTVAFTTPAANASVSALPLVNGTAKGDREITSVQLELKRVSDGKKWTGTSWAIDGLLTTTLSGPGKDRVWTRNTGLPAGADLTPGAYLLTAIGSDTSKSASVQRSFTVVAAATKPTVTVTTPANGAFLKALTSGGGAAQNAAGGKVTVSLKRVSDGKFWSGTAWTATETALPTGLTADAWSKSSFPAAGANLDTQMQDGRYVLTATATSKAGAASTPAKSEFTIDRVAPATLTLINPPINAKIKALAKINGTATDNNSVTSVVFTYKRNSDDKFWTGTAWGAETVFPTNLAGPVNNRTWSISTGLPAGENLPLGNYGIFVTAIDSAGNKTTVSRSFNITETVPPTATITSPANATTVNALAQITGTANDTGGSGLQKVALTLRRVSDSKFWNGTEWVATSFDLSTAMTTATEGITWKCTMLPRNANLIDGSYRIVATATDKAGNDSPSVVSLFVLKRTTAPTPVARASSVQLSSASAAVGGTIQLTFTGALAGSATDSANYGVTADGEPVEIVSVQQKSPGVVVLTTEGLAVGAKLAVDYNLQDTAGGSVAGAVNVVVK